MTRTSTELIKRWRSGDESAATELYERYSDQLRSIVGRRLSKELSRKVDPDDIVQTTFGTYFRQTRHGECAFDSDAGVWKLLVTIALNKVRLRARRFATRKRNASLEIQGGNIDAPEGYLMDRLSRQPGYVETLEFQRLLEQVLEILPPNLAQVLRLRVAGFTQEEIAREIDVSERTVRRCFQEMRDVIHRSHWFD